MKSILIISGPTASGKTSISLDLAKLIPSEIINADMGQFYTPFGIGTAKPDWKKQKAKHHLFDIIDIPEDLTVAKYRKLVLEKAEQIWNNGKLPIIIGGSLFYIKSLYYPPKNIEKQKGKAEDVALLKRDKEQEDLWTVLSKIDPKRAAKLHPNDTYRIERALAIWYETGVKPSECEPEFNPNFNSIFLFINPPKDILVERIEKRTVDMIKKDGWIQEAEQLLSTGWEEFINRKGFIGYPEIFEWIKNGKKESELDLLIQDIVCKTWQYAKRQITFWKPLKKNLLLKENQKKSLCKVIEIKSVNEKNIEFVKDNIDETLL